MTASEHRIIRCVGRLARLVNRVGRRGAFLGFLAVLDWLYGWSLIAGPLPPGVDLPWFHPYVWGAIWIAAGVVCMLGMPARRDWPSFTVAAAIKAVWAMVYARLWLGHHMPRAWVTMVIWLMFALVTVMIASWPEQTVIVMPPEGNGR